MRVLYVATSSFPGDSAYSTRIQGICQALNNSGHEIIVLTDYSNKSTGEFYFNSFKIISSARHIYPDRTLTDKLFASFRMIKALKKIIKTSKIDCVITSSIYMRIASIIRICRKENVSIILESCEWFDKYNWKKQEKSYKYKKYLKEWNRSFLQVDGVIAISKMLEEHFIENGIKTIRIPTIMDVEKSRWNQDKIDDKIRLIFTGSVAWGKDRVKEVISAIAQISDERLEFNIYGPTYENVIQQLEDEAPILEKLKNTVHIHGRIPHEQIAEKCMNSDFGIIIRPDRRQSNAGFPTKLAEYMSSGTPVIANDTGDIGLYLSSCRNGFLLDKGFKQQDLVSLLRSILNMTNDEIIEMRKNARKEAIDSFDYTNYSRALDVFIGDICNESK